MNDLSQEITKFLPFMPKINGPPKVGDFDKVFFISLTNLLYVNKTH